MTISVYDPSVEWEYLDFPIEISNLKFEKNLHSLSNECKIKIWRDSEFKLQAEISGYVLNPDTFGKNTKEDGHGSFAMLDTISGYGISDAHRYLLTNTVIGSYKCDANFYYHGLGLPFTASLHVTSFSKLLCHYDLSDPAVHYEWFICASVNLHYPGMTKRFNQETHKRIRVGIDSDMDTDNIRPISLSRDFFTINTPEIKCIVSKVPKEMKLDWAECFCVEYRTSVNQPLPHTSSKRAVQDFLSFLFGTELINIGTTIYSTGMICFQTAISPIGDNVKHKCQNGSMPPVFFIEKYHWGKIQYLVDTLFPKYLQQNKKLNLEDVLWRYFQGTDLTIGVNLPTLSSALEMLANNYLKENNLITQTYIPQNDYLSLIADELMIIEKKLANIPEQKKILNKIKKANERSANEKIDFFFKAIDLPLSDTEKAALRARNSMAHGSADAKTIEKGKELILKTTAYETLFNRTILRILGYNDYYIDYHTATNRVRPIRTPGGTNQNAATAKQNI